MFTIVTKKRMSKKQKQLRSSHIAKDALLESYQWKMVRKTLSLKEFLGITSQMATFGLRILRKYRPRYLRKTIVCVIMYKQVLLV